MNTYQAYETLNISSSASFEEIKTAYRKLALESHPDKNKSSDDLQFKKITEAYHLLKKHHKTDRKNKKHWKYTNTTTKKESPFRRSRWGANPKDRIPEEDWSKFTREFEENTSFWKEYERKFWEEYEAAMRGKREHDFEKTKEPKVQPNLNVQVDPTLCIGCCSCETIAPEVFLVDKDSKMNPKSRVINKRGAGVNKIMNAAETCPTKAIIVDNEDTKERLHPV